MKTFRLREDSARIIEKSMINEAHFSDHIEHGKRFLDTNYMRAETEIDGKRVGIFLKVDGGVPTKKTLWKQDILDELDRLFYTRITNDKTREGFINQLLNDWWDNKISKYGSLSNYSNF